MSEPKPFPTPRYRIEFKGRAQTWQELKGIVRQVQTELTLRREPGAFSTVSGGGWHVKVTEPDPTQTPQRWADELDAWWKKQDCDE